jgi:hypothetical protein
MAITESPRQLAKREKTGRDYNIDNLTILDYFQDAEKRLINSDKVYSKMNDAFLEELGDIKRHREKFTDLTLRYRNVGIRETDMIGALMFQADNTGIDWFSSQSGNIIIPSGTKIVRLSIPIIDFSDSGNNAAVRPGLISSSLKEIAQNKEVKKLKPKFFIGLTHPRLGDIAKKRWGFHLEEKPFPKEIYIMFDAAIVLATERNDEESLKDLVACRDQVLVYMTSEELEQGYKNK